MSAKSDIEEAVKSGLSGIQKDITYIRKDLTEFKAEFKNLPCNKINEDVIRLVIKGEGIEEDIKLLETAKGDLYSKFRKLRDEVNILNGRDSDRKEWSNKTWAFILIATTSIINAIFRFM